jgi:iron(III) transport system permease protein
MDALTTLILAIPGTAIGIAYIRAFNFPLPLIDIPLTSMWIVLPLVLAVRRLPYTVRGSHSSLLLVHRSMEEAAENVGATKLQVFRDITVPLVWKGILVGALFSFLTSIQEASATIFLTLGGWEMMPFGIFTFYIAGSQSQAAALGVILIAMCAISLYIVNRIAGTRVGGLFG